MKVSKQRLEAIWTTLTGQNVIDLNTISKDVAGPVLIDGRRGRPLEKLRLVDIYDVGDSKRKHYRLSPLGVEVLRFAPVPDGVDIPTYHA